MIVSMSFVGGLVMGKYKGMEDSEKIINKLITERDNQINKFINDFKTEKDSFQTEIDLIISKPNNNGAGNFTAAVGSSKPTSPAAPTPPSLGDTYFQKLEGSE